jgi:UDP-2,3-diacylglucosamine hydrolase
MHIFISDAHIRTDASYRSRMLVRFLREMRHKITNLYILGDLFEFWFEYNIVFPKDYFKTLAALYNLILDGKTIHYIMGNHEVMIGRFLKNFGFVVHSDPTTFNIDDKRIFLAHGNKIDKRIWTSIWESLLTSKLNHALYSLIHPDIGVFLAQGIAYLSRKQRRSPNLINLLENYACAKLNDVDVVMLAHSHVPVFKKFPDNKYYINTGDWLEHFSYGEINHGTVALRYYRP